jgi:hypothetical protein
MLHGTGSPVVGWRCAATSHILNYRYPPTANENVVADWHSDLSASLVNF